MPTVWPFEDLILKCGMIDVEEIRQLLDVLLGSFTLAVEDGSDSDFIATEFLGNGFEGDALPLLCVEERRGGLRKARKQRGLTSWSTSIIDLQSGQTCLHQVLRPCLRR